MLDSITNLGYRPKIAPSKLSLEQIKTETSTEWVMPDLLASALLEAERTDKLVLVDFFAEWCGACRKLDKSLSDPDLNNTLKHFVFIKIDTDEYPETARHFKVTGMPTILVLNIVGEEQTRQVGPIEAQALKKRLSGLW